MSIRHLKLFYLCTHHNDSPYQDIIFFAVDHDGNIDLSQLLDGLPDSDSPTNGSLAADSLVSGSLDVDSPPWHPMEYIDDVWSPQGVSTSESQSDLPPFPPLPPLPPDNSEINPSTTTPRPGPSTARSAGLNRPPVQPGVARRRPIQRRGRRRQRRRRTRPYVHRAVSSNSP